MSGPNLGDVFLDVRRPEAGELARFKVIAISRTRITLERTDGLQQSLPLTKLAKFYRPVEAVPPAKEASGA